MFETVVVCLLAAHLLAVNLASAGPLVAAWLDAREGRGDADAGTLGRRLAAWSLASLVIGVLLGLALGWLCWNPGYLLAVHRLRSKIYFGVAEIVFSLVLMSVHLALWNAGRWNGKGGRRGRHLLALLASTNLLYHFPLLLVVFARIASGADPGDDPLSSADFRARIVDPAVLARSLHVWLASFAVAGVALTAAALRGLPPVGSSGASSGASPADEPLEALQLRTGRWGVYGARLALVPSLLQVLSGVWLLVTLDPAAQGRLLGGDVSATLLFAAGVGAAFWLLHRLAGVALGDARPAALRTVVVGVAATVLLMTATLRQIEPNVRRNAASAEPSVPAAGSIERR